MSQVLKPVEIEQSVVYAVFDLTDGNHGSRKHVSLHLSTEGAAAVVKERQDAIFGKDVVDDSYTKKVKSLIYFQNMYVKP